MFTIDHMGCTMIHGATIRFFTYAELAGDVDEESVDVTKRALYFAQFYYPGVYNLLSSDIGEGIENFIKSIDDNGALSDHLKNVAKLAGI